MEEEKPKLILDEREIITKLEAFEKNNKVLVDIMNEKLELQKALTDVIDCDKELEKQIDIKINDKQIDKLEKLRLKKDDLVKEAIGQMYKGSLVEGKLSFRKGKFYEFRRQYELDLKYFKSIILDNLHEVRGKLTDESMDILEFLLNKIDEDEGDSNIELVSLPIDNYVLTKEDYRKQGDMRVKVFDSIKIMKNRYKVSIKACFKNEELYLDDNEEKILLYRHKAKLQEIINNLNKTINQLVKDKEAEVENIKDRAKNLLIVSALQKDGEVFDK